MNVPLKHWYLPMYHTTTKFNNSEDRNTLRGADKSLDFSISYLQHKQNNFSLIG
jgi:hypothetical protein